MDIFRQAVQRRRKTRISSCRWQTHPLHHGERSANKMNAQCDKLANELRCSGVTEEGGQRGQLPPGAAGKGAQNSLNKNKFASCNFADCSDVPNCRPMLSCICICSKSTIV